MRIAQYQISFDAAYSPTPLINRAAPIIPLIGNIEKKNAFFDVMPKTLRHFSLGQINWSTYKIIYAEDIIDVPATLPLSTEFFYNDPTLGSTATGGFILPISRLGRRICQFFEDVEREEPVLEKIQIRYLNPLSVANFSINVGRLFINDNRPLGTEVRIYTNIINMQDFISPASFSGNRGMGGNTGDVYVEVPLNIKLTKYCSMLIDAPFFAQIDAVGEKCQMNVMFYFK